MLPQRYIEILEAKERRQGRAARIFQVVSAISRFFRTGKKRIVVDGVLHEKNEEDLEDLDGEESRDLENRMASETVLKLLRDYIIQENLTVKKALGIFEVTNNIFVSRDYLKNQLK